MSAFWDHAPSQSARNYFVANAKTTTMTTVDQGVIAGLPIPLPPLPEQHAIANALSDADALIESLEHLIAKKRHLKLGAMQELLTGERRLPGFEGKWTRNQLGAKIDLLTGFPFPSQSYSDHGIRLLRGSNIKRGVTDWSDEITKCWSRITSDITQYQLQAGDIVIAMDGSLVGRSFAQLSESDLPALLLQRVARIRSTMIDMAYLKEQVCSDYFTEHCDAVKTVTAIPHISPKDIREFTIPIPPTKEEQKAIAGILRDMDAEITALEAKLAKAHCLKQGMMQELLTGRIRLV
jgi:type I restriction enzyme, S subunit